MGEMIARRFRLSVWRHVLPPCARRTPTFTPNCPFHCTVRRSLPAAFDDQIFQIALKEYRDLESRNKTSHGGKAYGDPKKIYNVSTDNIDEHVARDSNSTGRAAVLALSMALASDKQVCASATAAEFIVNLVKRITAPGNAQQRGNVYVAARVALGAATVLLSNRHLDLPQRCALQEFCAATLELSCSEHVVAMLTSNVQEGSTLVYLCKTLALVDRTLAQTHIASLAETLARTEALEAHNFATCLGYLQPLLTRELRHLLYGPAERVDLSLLDPVLAMIMALFFRRMLPAGVVPSNGEAWLDYLLRNGEHMELLCVTDVLELCVRCGAIDGGGGTRDAAARELLGKVIETRCRDATANTIATFMLSLLSQGRRGTVGGGDGGGDRWMELARLCADSLLPRCHGDTVDGAPCHHATLGTLLWVLVSLGTCPPDLYLAWLGVVMDNAERLTFYQLWRILDVFTVSHRSFVMPVECLAEARQRLARGVGRVALSHDGDWMAGVEGRSVVGVAAMCSSLVSLGILYPPPARRAAEWLLRTRSIAADADSWCRIAASCITMGAPPDDFARAALLHVAAAGGAGLSASAASTIAWIGGPLANVMPEPVAMQCMQIMRAGCGAAVGDGDAPDDSLLDHLLDNVLVTHCWAGGQHWSLDADTLSSVSARYCRLRSEKERSGVSRKIFGYVRSALGDAFVHAGGDLRVDYLPVSAMALFSLSLDAFVPCRTHMDAWQRCDSEQRRRGDLRAVCMLPCSSDKFLRSQLAVADLADPFLHHHRHHHRHHHHHHGRRDDGDTLARAPGASWTVSPRVVAYARALSTLGVHTVLPLSHASFSQWESGACLADYLRALVVAGPSFEAFCPPWKPRADDDGAGVRRATTTEQGYF